MKLRHYSVLFSFCLLITVAFQNCSVESRTGMLDSRARFQSPPGLPAINYFKETPPPLICGKSGWAYLMRNYISRNCSSCHYSGSFAPTPFADTNLDTAYNNAQWISDTQWHTFTTQNKFCVPNCDIVPEGEVYQGLMEWSHHVNCP